MLVRRKLIGLDTDVLTRRNLLSTDDRFEDRELLNDTDEDRFEDTDETSTSPELSSAEGRCILNTTLLELFSPDPEMLELCSVKPGICLSSSSTC